MKRVTTVLFLTLTVVWLSAGAMAADFNSLRGGLPLNENSKKPDKKRVMSVQGGIARSFEKQPPVIPHTIDKYKIDMHNNGCMKCHSEETFEREKAPRVGDSHYVARDGKVLDKLSSRRYFCTQCHVTQVEAQPLVQNLYGSGN